MKVHLVFPRLPPTRDGIGDYTARLAAALAERCDVKILTAQDVHTPIPNVDVRQAFRLAPLQGIQGLRSAVAEDPPDWLVLQYNPFSYGRWGWNPYLPTVAHTLKRTHPDVGLALMVHEVMPPLLNARLALMATWQLAQLWRLGRAADTFFVAIEPWVVSFRRWFRTTPVRHLPVGSNLRYRSVAREDARRHLGIGDPVFTVGVFGTAHPTRRLDFVRAAVAGLRRETNDVLVLYVGPDGGRVREHLGDLPLHDAGLVPADDASRYFAAMDVCLAPFRRGTSTRRGSFLAALQHGVATVSTAGAQTDALLLDADGEAFVLTADGDQDAFCTAVDRLYHDAARRTALARSGQALYRAVFDWNHIAGQLADGLAHRLPTCSNPTP